jgi:hypothetical protein
MDNVTDRDAGDAADLAAAMAAAALVLKEPETVEDALARLVVAALSVTLARSSVASLLPT